MFTSQLFPCSLEYWFIVVYFIVTGYAFKLVSHGIISKFQLQYLKMHQHTNHVLVYLKVLA